MKLSSALWRVKKKKKNKTKKPGRVEGERAYGWGDMDHFEGREGDRGGGGREGEIVCLLVA